MELLNFRFFVAIHIWHYNRVSNSSPNTLVGQTNRIFFVGRRMTDKKLNRKIKKAPHPHSGNECHFPVHCTRPFKNRSLSSTAIIIAVFYCPLTLFVVPGTTLWPKDDISPAFTTPLHRWLGHSGGNARELYGPVLRHASLVGHRAHSLRVSTQNIRRHHNVQVAGLKRCRRRKIRLVLHTRWIG